MISLLSVMAVIQISENSLNICSVIHYDSVNYPLLLEIKFLTSEVSIGKNYLLTYFIQVFCKQVLSWRIRYIFKDI